MIANHWYDKYQYKTQCSPGYPYVRKLRDSEVQFTDPEKLIKFMKCSSDASFMWSDSEDLAIISDMYQIKIKVITTRGTDDKNPTINWIFPDSELKKFAELNVEINEMVLLHQDDNHFNLIVSANSDLAKMGSLSNRFSVGPVEESNDASAKSSKGNNLNEENPKAEEKDDKELENLRKQLTNCLESKKHIENEYFKCEKELKMKTEEVEVLQIKVKDLNLIVELSKKLNDSMSNGNANNSSDKVDEQLDASKEFWRSKNAGLYRKTPRFESSPKTNKTNKDTGKHTIEEEFNCMKCDFQGTSKMLLEKHINMKHTQKESNSNELIKCRSCGEQFNEKWKMMTHRKTEHCATVAVCRNNLVGKCNFSDDFCWWSHKKQKDTNIGDNPVQCFICNKTFESKVSMMSHRKSNHQGIIRQCNQYLTKSCRFNSDSCWYKHEDENVMEEEALNDSVVAGKDEDEWEYQNKKKQVFQKASEKLKPPISK